MAAYWPAGLPAPQLGGSFTTAMKRQVSDFDVAKIERVTDKNYIQNFPASWTMTEVEFQVFVSWWVHGCADGAAWFAVDWDGRSGLARFTSKYSASLDGTDRKVSAPVEIDYA